MITIANLTQVLKPHAHTNHLQLAANHLRAIKEAQRDGEADYEIRALDTRNGRPYIIRF